VYKYRLSSSHFHTHNSPYLVYLEHSKRRSSAGGLGFLVFGILVLVYLWRDIM
jgi:hypothetical protein